MLDSLLLIGAAMAFAGIIALANPILMGWRTRRDAVIMLAIAAALLTAGWMARAL